MPALQGSGQRQNRNAKKIAFYCTGTLVEAWTIHKISLPACDSTYFLITNQFGDRGEFVNQDDALKAMCADAYQSCPDAVPGLAPQIRGEYSPRLMSYIEADANNPSRQDDAINRATPPLFSNAKVVEIMPGFPGCEELDGSDPLKNNVQTTRCWSSFIPGSNTRKRQGRTALKVWLYSPLL